MTRRRTPAPSRAVIRESTTPHATNPSSSGGHEAHPKAERLRVLVLTTESGWGAGTRLLAMLASTLLERGAKVSVVCCRRSATERLLVRDYPSLSRRTVSARSLLLRVGELRTIVRSEHPAAIFVQNDRDELAAALAIGREGTVVRRLRVGEMVRRGWMGRVATGRARCVLLADERGGGVQRGVIGWPSGEARPSDGYRIAPTMPPPTVAVVAARASEAGVDGARRGREHAAGALALRAAARLLSRHPELRVQLVGDAATLQSLRLHAGSLGLAERLSVVPLESLLGTAPFESAIVWVALEGDDGAAATIAAMARRIPVVVPRGSDLQHLVAPRISGFLADESELPALVSSLAHLLADGEEFRAMGTAAASRADRLHGWSAFVARVESVLRGGAGDARAAAARPPGAEAR